MKTYELYFFRTEKLQQLQQKLQVELEAAEDADAEAWKRYEALTQAEYEADAAKYDAEVDGTSRRCRDLRMQLESLKIAINACEVLESEVDFLIDSKVL